MKSKRISLFVLLLAACSVYSFAQPKSLQRQIEQVVTLAKADVGVAVYNLETKQSAVVNGHKHYPMQSVFKFHIALCVLSQVDKGILSLDQKILLKPSDLLPNTYSPLRDAYPKGNVKVSLAEILSYTVSHSDNNGADILLRLVGGAKVVNDYLHQLGIKDVAIQVNEKDMHDDWNAQFKNWTTPLASNQLLQQFYTQKILAPQTYAFLIKIMAETTTGKDRIRGPLPKETVVMHKTGTSDTNRQGITAAVNDIGIVTLPNGKHLLLSVFVANSKEKPAIMEKIIADISKLSWENFKQ